MNDDAGNPFAELLEEYVAECARSLRPSGIPLATSRALGRSAHSADPAVPVR